MQEEGKRNHTNAFQACLWQVCQYPIGQSKSYGRTLSFREKNMDMGRVRNLGLLMQSTTIPIFLLKDYLGELHTGIIAK